MFHVLLAHRYPVIREGLKKILADTPGVKVVAEASSAQELRRMLSKFNSESALILDLFFPAGGAFELLREIKESHPNVPTLVFGAPAEKDVGLRLYKMGACGYVTKDSPPEKIIQAVESVLKQRRYFSKVTEDKIFDELNHKTTDLPRHELLSDREFHVFLQLGAGKTITEIAKDLFLSVKTVSTYKQRVLKKMSMLSVAEIVAYLVSTNLDQL